MKFRKLTLVFLAVLLSVSVAWAAGDIKRKFKAGGRDQVIGSGDGYVQLGGANTGEHFSSTIDLVTDGYYATKIEVNIYQGGAGNNDNTGVSIYGLTYDPATPIASGVSTLASPLSSLELPTDTAGTSGVTQTWIIWDEAYIVIGVSKRNTGDTDTYVRAYSYPWYGQYTDNWMIWGA